VVVQTIGTAADAGGDAMTPSARALARVAVVIVSSLIALEVGLRIRNPFPFRVRGDHIVLPSHQSYTISHPGAIKLDAVTHVTKNSLGFRGPEPPRDWAERLTVLTIGGSTTECLFLSDGRTWTDQLTRRMMAVRPDAWINNAGFEGHSTFGHLVLLREFVVSMRPKVALFLTGYNDMKLRAALPRDGEFVPQSLSTAHRLMTFVADHSQVGAVSENFVRMFRTYQAGVRSDEIHPERLATRPLDEEKTNAILDEHRSRYLAGYAGRLTEIIELCRRNGIEPVLLTQPALYGDVIDPTTGVALGPLAIGSVSNGRVEWQSLELYNDVARRLSAELGVRLIDLAHELPKESRYFTDWVHYTNDGAKFVGDIVFAHLQPWLAAGQTRVSG
jgi:lysophospholipase L1-like esterase